MCEVQIKFRWFLGIKRRIHRDWKMRETSPAYMTLQLSRIHDRTSKSGQMKFQNS